MNVYEVLYIVDDKTNLTPIESKYLDFLKVEGYDYTVIAALDGLSDKVQYARCVMYCGLHNELATALSAKFQDAFIFITDTATPNTDYVINIFGGKHFTTAPQQYEFIKIRVDLLTHHQASGHLMNLVVSKYLRSDRESNCYCKLKAMEGKNSDEVLSYIVKALS